MKLALAAAFALTLLANQAFAVPGVKRSRSYDIHPKKQESAAAPRAERSLDSSYSLVGTISCDACASPFQPVAVVRQHSTSKLVHLRVGDELAAPSGDHVVVMKITAKHVDFQGNQGNYRLSAGGFPDESADEGGAMIARTPPSFMPPPPPGANW